MKFIPRFTKSRTKNVILSV
uniref:Uncharacterized protein n=1 Tax=Anguilla anguilla TaxID=7936 RepID=A0A0E9UEU5_ANGAN